jgi:hypothetical protein
MRKFIAGLGAVALLGVAGCFSPTVNVPSPPDVYVSRSPRVDSSRVPKTRTHEECRAELERAYGYIVTLERRNQRLENDKANLKAEVKRLKSQLKAYGKKYEN